MSNHSSAASYNIEDDADLPHVNQEYVRSDDDEYNGDSLDKLVAIGSKREVGALGRDELKNLVIEYIHANDKFLRLYQVIRTSALAQSYRLEHVEGSLEASQRLVKNREGEIKVLEGQARALRDCLDCAYAERDLLKSNEQKLNETIGALKKEVGVKVQAATKHLRSKLVRAEADIALEKAKRVKAQEASKVLQAQNLALSEKLKANKAHCDGSSS